MTKLKDHVISNLYFLMQISNDFLKDIIRWLQYKYPSEKIRLTGNKLTLVSQVAKYLCYSNKQDIGADTIYKTSNKASVNQTL